MKLTVIATVGLVALVGAGVYLVLQNENESEKQQMQAAFDKKLQQLENKFNEQKTKTEQELQSKVREMADAVKGTEIVKKVDGSVSDQSVKGALDAVKNKVLANNGGPAAVANPQGGPAAPPAVAPEPPVLDTDSVAAQQARKLEDDLLNGSGVNDGRIAVDNARITGALPATEPEGDKLNDVQSLIVAQPRIARVGDARAADNAGLVVLDEGLNKNLAKGDRFAIRRGTILVARVVVSDNIQATQCVADIVPGSLVQGMSVKNGDDVIKFDR